MAVIESGGNTKDRSFCKNNIDLVMLIVILQE